MLSEFAAGHSAADVLRELVQNEYDAHGTTLSVEFGNESLTIRGTGDAIDQAGWTRLQVMVGTGLIAGTSIAVPRKVNGIGSKNFGLRSLFLFGDQISVASGGRRTVLDRHRGSLREPEPYPETGSASGVTIEVPYRSSDDGDLSRFDEARERGALRDISDVLGPTLVKLAAPKPQRGISAVQVSSKRLNYQLAWNQSAKQLKEPGSPIVRTVQVEAHGTALEHVPTSFREIEYSRLIVPPLTLRGRATPSYFRVAGGRLRIGVSFQVQRGRILPGNGVLYYPLGAIRARTGAHFSVSGPFAMNEDRSHLLDPAHSDWNRWLLQELADFVVDLLPKCLFARFGSAAYAAVQPSDEHATIAQLPEMIERRLRDQRCWPSRSLERGKPVFASASTLTVPVPALDEIGDTLAADRVLHAALSSNDASSRAALRAGARPFTVNSLVRLRCAASDAAALATKDEGGAGWHYRDYQSSLRGESLQVRLALAIDRMKGDLSQANLQDLTSTASTLTRAGSLGAPGAPLWIVEDSLAAVVPAETSLHPALAGTKVIAGMCKRFEPSRWAIETARAAQSGGADDAAVAALRRYVFGSPMLSAPAWAAVRSAPVLLDHLGQRAAASDLVLRLTPGAVAVEPVLRYLPEGDESNAESVERLRIRDTIRSDDLVLLAEAVANKQVPPSQMLTALDQHSRLLTPTLAKRLERIEFVETTNGNLVSPSSTYVRNSKTTTALGVDFDWPKPAYRTLLSRLNCRKDPETVDIVRRLRSLQRAALPLPQPESVYRLLLEAAQRERFKLGTFASEPIVWTGHRWGHAAQCLLDNEHTRIFRGAVPVLTTAREPFAALGVPARPGPDHWRLLFLWVASTATIGQQVPRRMHDVLLTAYGRNEAVPAEVPIDALVLLDENGVLHSRAEARDHVYLIDDNPAVASALRTAAAPMSFAYPDPLIKGFLQRSGVALLSDVATHSSTIAGPEVDVTDSRVVAKLLSCLSSPVFASAAAALAASVCGPKSQRGATALEARLAAIRSIVVVEFIRRDHRVGSLTVATEIDHLLDGSRLAVAKARTQEELRRAVARAIATIVEPGAEGQRLLADPLFFLMRCRVTAEMQRELEQRNIPWSPPDVDHGMRDDGDRGEDDQDVEAVGEALHQSIIRTIQTRPSTPTPATTSAGPVTPPTPPPARQLPALDAVQVSSASDLPEARPKAGSGGGSTLSTWSPRTPQQTDDDRILGRRGEELIFRWEQRKLAERGQDTSEVIWVADTSPAANHDIRSLDADGQEIWIEVKATSARHGRFSWPKSEFQLAVAKRDHYYLVRVYEVDTLNPTIIEIQDPIGRFERGLITLDLDVFAADAGTLRS